MGKIAIKTNTTADITSILPEVLRFYDATATSTITLASGTNNITSWGDRSINNVAATQTVGNQQPIYNTGTGLRTIRLDSNRNFLVNFGSAAFNGTVYIADSVHGVLDFNISVGGNTQLNIWTADNFQPRTVNAFLNIIGIVITSNPNHRSVIENYFGGRSQNLRYGNITNFQDYWITDTQSTNFARRVNSFPLINTVNGTNFFQAWYQCSGLTSFPLINTANGTNFYAAWYQCSGLTSFPLINTANGTNFTLAWYQCSGLTSFPLINTANGTNFTLAWYQCTGLTSFPLINTANGTNFSYAWAICSGLTSFPLINTANATNFQQVWTGCPGLTSFPAINTANGTNFQETWRECPGLTSFPAINTVNGTFFQSTWHTCSGLTSLSLDNILISIAAGLANNTTKTITDVSSIFEGVGAILTNTNCRPTDPNDTQDTISDWNTIINNYLSGVIDLQEMRNQHAQAIQTYNNKWKTWEQALRNINESLNGVQYNFSNGIVSGQKARFWILAKRSLNIPLGAAPVLLTVTDGVTRSYRSDSGLTVNGSNVSAWTPVTGTSNQTISGLTTQTINGILCVMFSSSKTITFNSISVGTGHRVYIGTLYGYVTLTPPTATNLRVSTDTATELPIISIMITTTAVNQTEVLLRLGFYGSFQEFNYTANGLTSANIQLTSV